MPRADRADKDLDSSTEILLAEHERLSDLFLYNSDLGEKRTTAYLTLVSLGVGGLLGFSQLDIDQTTMLELSAGILAGIFLLGFITFFRLIERRIRNTEYLRAINRIHAYFANNDPEVGPYFFWPHADDVPSFSGKFSDFTALREIIAILNSVFFGTAVVLLGHLFQPEPRSVITELVVLGVILGIGVLAAQIAIETVVLRKEERLAQAAIRFPSGRLSSTGEE
jgi:hypothetical protein